MVQVSPLACNNLANDEAIMPFPNELVTPPVTKMYFAFLLFPLPDIRMNCLLITGNKDTNNNHIELILFLFYLAL
jgi:hypothetical protein